MKRMLRGLAVVGLVAATTALAAGPAAAAGFTVNSTADVGDAIPGDGTCETVLGNGTCTLRAAVEEADANGSPSDVITLPPGLYRLSTGNHLEVTSGHIEIDGAGTADTIISGDGLTRMFFLYGGDLTISDATMRRGRATGSPPYGDGGAIWVEFDATLTLDKTVLTSNRAQGTGGAVFIQSGTVAKIVDSRLVYNRGDNGTGAISNWGQVWIRESEVSKNRGKYTGGITNRGSTFVTNTTVSGNTATEETWGGVGGIRNDAWLEVDASTIHNNRSTGHPDYRIGGGIGTTVGEATSTRVNNTILWRNRDDGTGMHDCAVPLTNDSQHVVMTTTTGCGVPAITATWLIGVDPQLGSLAFNGGPTKTHALAKTSPAIDAGFGPAAAVGHPCPKGDQRGAVRTKVCDIGAYEHTGLALTPGTVPSPIPSLRPKPEPFPGPLTTSTTLPPDQPGDGK